MYMSVARTSKPGLLFPLLVQKLNTRLSLAHANWYLLRYLCKISNSIIVCFLHLFDLNILNNTNKGAGRYKPYVSQEAGWLMGQLSVCIQGTVREDTDHSWPYQ